MKHNNLAEMFFSNREKFAAHTAYKYKEGGRWIPVTYEEAINRVEKIACGLASLGIQKGDRIAIISENRIEWALSDFAALTLGAALVPVYPSLLANQVQYILNDSGAKILIVADELQMKKVDEIRENLESIRHYFVIEAEHIRSGSPWQAFDILNEKGNNFLRENADYLKSSIKDITREDIATIIYTSGTTGEPKGAVLSHKNFLSNCESISQIFECYPDDVFLSFLPLSHIFERMGGHFFTCFHATTVVYAESIDTVGENMQEIKPTLMVSVPRLYEKIYSRVLEAVEIGSPLKRKIFYWSVGVGREYLKKSMKKEHIPALLKFKKAVAFKLVFSKLKKRVGGRLRYFISGGAPLAAEIGEFFSAAGLIILEAYGLTETSPAITFNRPESFKFGAVGLPIPGVEIKIAKDGEILARGDNIMIGYLNKEAETREVIDELGWFHTGDIGYIDDDGSLIITDRKKNIIVTSGGKNIPPQPIENTLITSKYIEQSVVIGDKRKFCTAVIVPSEEALTNWAKKENISFTNYNDFLKQDKTIELIQAEIDRLIVDFARFEHIKKFCLIAEPFSMDGGELTPTLKVKRKVVEKKYSTEIDKLYGVE